MNDATGPAGESDAPAAPAASEAPAATDAPEEGHAPTRLLTALLRGLIHGGAVFATLSALVLSEEVHGARTLEILRTLFVVAATYGAGIAVLAFAETWLVRAGRPRPGRVVPFLGLGFGVGVVAVVQAGYTILVLETGSPRAALRQLSQELQDVHEHPLLALFLAAAVLLPHALAATALGALRGARVPVGEQLVVTTVLALLASIPLCVRSSAGPPLLFAFLVGSLSPPAAALADVVARAIVAWRDGDHPGTGSRR